MTAPRVRLARAGLASRDGMNAKHSVRTLQKPVQTAGIPPGTRDAKPLNAYLTAGWNHVRAVGEAPMTIRSGPFIPQFAENVTDVIESS